MSTGHKKWATGDLVEATAFNSYVQNQIVGVYDDSTARDNAFGGTGEPTLAEGMVCYLKDTNEFQIYSGSAWVALLDLDTLSVSSGNYAMTGNLDVDGTTNLDAVDIDGVVTLVVGSDSAPTIVFDGDADTGIYAESTGEVDITINGTRTFVFDTGYFKLLGTTTSALRNSPSTSRDILELRSGGTSLTSGAGYNLYGGADNAHANKHIFFTGSSQSRFVIDSSGAEINGSFTKDSGTFDIAHPTRGGDWRLRHSFIEGPKADNIYRGTITLDASGTTTVDLDEDSGMTDGTWEALNTNSWSMVASSGNAVTWDLDGKILTIDGPEGAQCSWMVIGERHDQTVIDWKATNDQGQLITEYEKQEDIIEEDNEEETDTE